MVADAQRIERADLIDRADALDVRPLLGPEDREAADHQRHGHRHRREQHAADRVLEQEARDRRRQEGEEEVGGEPPRSRIRDEPERRAPQSLTILPADGEDRRALHHDHLPEADRLLETERGAHDDEVAGARDRQELGEALDEAEQDVDQPLHGRRFSPASCGRGSR
jgi:hypothetical protein